MTKKSHRNWKRAEAHFMPWMSGLATVLTLIMAVYYAVLFILAFGFYLLAAAIVIPVVILALRFRRSRKELFAGIAK